MKRTTEDRKNLHMEMWNELAETGDDEKRLTQTMSSLSEEDTPLYDCFLCEEFHNGIDCAGCPFSELFKPDKYEAASGEVPCQCSGAFFVDWFVTDYIDERKRLALEIACIWED